MKRKKSVLFLMDCQNQNVSWQWQGVEYLHQKDVNFDLSKCGWNGITPNEPNIPYMLEERTPVKACGEVPYHVNDCGIMTKTPQESEDFFPPPKRRRMLDFDDVNEDLLSSSLKSKERIDAIDDFLSEISQWEACLQEDLSPLGFEDLSQPEAWLAECLDVTNMNINSDEGSAYIASGVQIGETEVCSNALDSTTNMAQRPVRSSRNVIFRGRKSYMRAPPKQGSTSSIAYPFEFIKPCSVRGDVTLKDINHRLRTPPPPKPVEKDPPISAFSGKPVIGKTRIPTQGGQGSITIMRTKG